MDIDYDAMIKRRLLLMHEVSHDMQRLLLDPSAPPSPFAVKPRPLRPKPASPPPLPKVPPRRAYAFQSPFGRGPTSLKPPPWRRRGGQPGNRNAVTHGLTTAAMRDNPPMELQGVRLARVMARLALQVYELRCLRDQEQRTEALTVALAAAPVPARRDIRGRHRPGMQPAPRPDRRRKPGTPPSLQNEYLPRRQDDRALRRRPP